MGREAQGGWDHGVASVSGQLSDGVDVLRAVGRGLGMVQGWGTRGEGMAVTSGVGRR